MNEIILISHDKLCKLKYKASEEQMLKLRSSLYDDVFDHFL